jgi:serine protease inhibitor
MQSELARRVVVMAAVVALVAGCSTSSPSTSPGAGTPTPSQATLPATPTAAPSASPAATSAPTPTAKPVALAPFVGKVVVTVSDNLVVRSEPRVSDDSIMYKPWLPTGTELKVLDGPVSGSGFTWYEVAPVSFAALSGPGHGWVAMAGKDGEPWIALPEAEIAGIELAKADVARAPADPAAAKKAAASINAFGLDLLRAMLADGTLKPDENAVFSPTSITLALAMARAGAKGETASQMDAVLHTAGWDELGAGLNALDQALTSRNATWREESLDPPTRELALRIANAAFAQRDWEIVQSYLDAIASTFGGGLRLVDYQADPEAARKAINAWVSRQTMKRIPELLREGIVRADNRLWLVNAIYLKANWELEFDKAATKPAPFTRLDGSRVRVPTMSQTDTIPYATGTGWKATELLYESGWSQSGDINAPLAMTLILPDDLASFEKKLTASGLRGIVGKIETARGHLRDEVACAGVEPRCCHHPYDVKVFLPRFGIETKADLEEILASMGMELATSGNADFSGITSPSELYISKVVHQANIDVDEKGTEAAAATAVGVSTTGGCGSNQPLKVITLRLDRPFLFVLRDVETGAVLFMGRVVDPSVGR